MHILVFKCVCVRVCARASACVRECVFDSPQKKRKKGNVLFNEAFNTFYLWLYEKEIISLIGPRC